MAVLPQKKKNFFSSQVSIAFFFTFALRPKRSKFVKL
jgi:hypothetical protein